MTEACKEVMRQSLINFFGLYNAFKGGICNFERNDKEFKMALLEAQNVMMMAILNDNYEELAD